MSRIARGLENLSPNGLVQRGNGIGNIPQIQEQSLAAPGLAVQPPVSLGAQMAGELSASLGLAANAADAIRAYTIRQQNEEERAQAKIDRELAKSEHLAEKVRNAQMVTGQGEGQVQLPEILSNIDQEKDGFKIDLAMSSADQAKQIADAYAPGTDPTAEGFRKQVTDNIAAGIQRKKDQRVAIANKNLADSASSTAVGAKTVEDIAVPFDVVSSIPGMTKEGAYRATYLEAMKAAAIGGTQESIDRFNAIDAAMPADVLMPERTQLRVAANANLAHAEKQQSEAIQDHALGLAFGGDTTAALNLVNAEAGKSIPFDRATVLRHNIVTTSQNRLHNNLQLAVMSGALDEKAIREVAAPFTLLPETDPNHLSASAASELFSAAHRAEKSDLSKEQVKAVIAGAPNVNLTDAQHGADFMKVLQSEGFIDAGNNVVNGGSLGIAMIRAKVMHPDLSQMLVANLNSNNPVSRVEAARAIGVAGTRDPIMENRLLDLGTNNPAVRAQIQAAMDQYKSGNLSDNTKTPVAMDAITQAGVTAKEQQTPTQDSLNSYERISKDLPGDALKVLRSMSDMYPQKYSQMTDDFNLLGIVPMGFMNPNPGIDNQAGKNVMKRIEGWLANEYANLDGQPIDVQNKQATERTRARIADNIDMVRWNDRLYPTSIDGVSGTSVKMPNNMRWTAEFEDEAKSGLKELGADITSISVPAPYVGRGGSVGWAFRRSDVANDFLRDSSGDVLVFFPTDKAAKKAADDQNIREQKLRNYRSFPDTNVDTSDGVFSPKRTKTLTDLSKEKAT